MSSQDLQQDSHSGFAFHAIEHTTLPKPYLILSLKRTSTTSTPPSPPSHSHSHRRFPISIAPKHGTTTYHHESQQRGTTRQPEREAREDQFERLVVVTYQENSSHEKRPHEKKQKSWITRRRLRQSKAFSKKRQHGQPSSVQKQLQKQFYRIQRASSSQDGQRITRQQLQQISIEIDVDRSRNIYQPGY